jgi:uncharacterized protein YbjT (DUF2867 family)
MKRSPILVTGATGKIGGAVVRELLSRGLPVRAVVRVDDVRSQALERQGAETVVADLYDPNQMQRAMQGAVHAFYVPPFQPHMIHSAVAFADAAREARLEHVVQLSQWTSSPSHPAILTRQTWLVDRLFATLPGIAHTIVNPGMFADNFLRVMDFPALLGIYPVLSGTSKSAPVSNEDIARVVAAVLAEPDRHAGMRYRPTGPKLLSAQEMAGVIARVVGRRVRPVNMPIWMLAKAGRLQKSADPFELVCIRYYMRDHRQGAFELGGGVTDVVRELTGTPAEDFEATARRYAAMPFARKTFSNCARAWLSFLVTPFYPGYDLARYEREHSFPTPTDARLTMDCDTWRREHAAERPTPCCARVSRPRTSA